jgi:hypothetical protein
MTDPDRLLESSDCEVERLLLRAGREGPPREGKHRALAAATAVMTSSTLAAGSAGVGTATGKAAFGAKVASLASVKWIAVIGVASFGVVTGAIAVRGSQAERAGPGDAPTAMATPARTPVSRAMTASGAPTIAPSVVTSPAVAAVLPEPGVAPVEPVLPAPGTTGTQTGSMPVVPAPAISLPNLPPRRLAPDSPAPAAVQHAPTSPSAGTPTGSTAATELAILDRARGAIGNRDPARALSMLDGYAARFPHGVMGPEATVLRIEALVNAGDRAAARRAADAFLLTNPTSPYAPRVQSLVGESNP